MKLGFMAALCTSLLSLQQVYFHAWGGSDEVNQYVRWAQQQLAPQDIELVHVKVADIGETVALLLRENAQQQTTSSVDLLWLNGENFHALKAAGALRGELSLAVPNSALLDPELGWQTDFGIATDDFELPWGVGQFHLLLRGQKLAAHLTPAELLAYAKSKPGRLSYPKPPEFHGTTFLKLLLLELNNHHPELYQAPQPDQQELLLAPLWDYLDQLHPLLWKGGREFPVSAAQQQQFLANGILDNAVSFNPGELISAQRAMRLPPNVGAILIGERAITNSHYLAIPNHAANAHAALKVIDFMLSEKAQQRKQAPDGWGDSAVIRFAQTDIVGSNAVPRFPAQPEPHVGWVKLIEQQWLTRYQQ